MIDDNTKDLTDGEKLNLILAELADLRTWRAKVDAFIEDRSRDTRPKLDLIHKEIADLRADVRELKEGQERIENRLGHVETKLDVMAVDLMDVRTVQRSLGNRVSVLEQRPN